MEPTPNPIIAIKSRMAAFGISQERLAISIGMERSALNRYLRGVRTFPQGFEARIHQALDVLEAAERAADEAREQVLLEASKQNGSGGWKGTYARKVGL